MRARDALFAVSFLLISASACLAQFHRDPLKRLEREIRKVPYMQAAYVAPLDDDYYWQGIYLQNRLAEIFNVPVQYVEFPGDEAENLAGRTVTMPETGRILIFVNARFHWTARFQTLAHEGAHALEPRELLENHGESEMFADSVSYLVCLNYGLDATSTYAHYLAQHKSALHVLRDWRNEILETARILSGK